MLGNKFINFCINACLVAQSCATRCNPMDWGPQGSSVHGIFQSRVLEWVAISSSRGFSWPRDQTHVSCISALAGEFFTTEPPGKPNSISERKVKLLVARSSPTFCNPMDWGPPGSSVHGFLQARILEWVAMPFSRGSSWPSDQTKSSALQADFLLSEPPGKPYGINRCS